MRKLICKSVKFNDGALLQLLLSEVKSASNVEDRQETVVPLMAKLIESVSTLKMGTRLDITPYVHFDNNDDIELITTQPIERALPALNFILKGLTDVPTSQLFSKMDQPVGLAIVPRDYVRNWKKSQLIDFGDMELTFVSRLFTLDGLVLPGALQYKILVPKGPLSEDYIFPISSIAIDPHYEWTHPAGNLRDTVQKTIQHLQNFKN